MEFGLITHNKQFETLSINSNLTFFHNTPLSSVALPWVSDTTMQSYLGRWSEIALGFREVAVWIRNNMSRFTAKLIDSSGEITSVTPYLLFLHFMVS